jgi:hypothetical protein
MRPINNAAIRRALAVHNAEVKGFSKLKNVVNNTFSDVFLNRTSLPFYRGVAAAYSEQYPRRLALLGLRTSTKPNHDLNKVLDLFVPTRIASVVHNSTWAPAANLCVAIGVATSVDDAIEMLEYLFPSWRSYSRWPSINLSLSNNFHTWPEETSLRYLSPWPSCAPSTATSPGPAAPACSPRAAGLTCAAGTPRSTRKSSSSSWRPSAAPSSWGTSGVAPCCRS